MARIEHGHELRARAFERIHGAGLDQALDHAPVHGAEIDALAEIDRSIEAARPPARHDDGFDRGRAHVLDRAQAEADAASVPGSTGVKSSR